MSAVGQRYSLMDVETANLVGTYESEEEALRQVAEAVHLYEPDSAEVRSLSLARDDGPPGPAFIASSLALAELALKTVGPVLK